MKLRYKLLLGASIFVALALTAVMVDAPMQKSVHIDRKTIGPFPIVGDEAEVELMPGLSFRISTATAVARLTPRTFSWLRDHGYVTDSMTRWIISRDNSNSLRLTTKMYRADLPVGTYRIEGYDSVTRQNKLIFDPLGPRGVIHDVDFVIAEPDDENTVGGRLLSNFLIELDYRSNAVLIHREHPDNYEFLTTFREGNGLSDMIGTGRRFYVDMKVDHETYSFLINTALTGIAVKMPFDRIDWSENIEPKRERIIDAAGGEQDAVVDQSAWIECGNRSGSSRVHYYADKGENFEMNPFVFFQQDVLIDFSDNSIYLRPYFDIDDK